jgi:lipopolysaccharide biosynthesis glycosyltransferase/trans-aconitate methyltransferase
MDLQHQHSTFTIRNRHSSILRLFEGKPIRTILSFGCSRGEELLTLVAAFPNSEVYGVDINTAALDEARERCKNVHQVHIFHSSEFPKNQTFDLITCFNVLCRFPSDTLTYAWTDYSTVVQQLFQQLQPDGILAIHNSNYTLSEACEELHLETVYKTDIRQTQIKMYRKNGEEIARDQCFFEYLVNRPRPQYTLSSDYQAPSVLELFHLDALPITQIGIYSYSRSTNIGDYIQSLAQINLWSVFYRNNWEIESPILRKVFEYFASTKHGYDPASYGSFRQKSYDTRVKVIWVDRDQLSHASIQEPTWVIANGWYLHPQEDGTFTFPPNEWVRPLFVSVHCQDPAMLTPDSVLYFKRYAPIGCRDINTMRLMKSKGIQAYFSGCLTTTLTCVQSVKHNTQFCIDIRKPNDGYEHVKHLVPEFKSMSPDDAMKMSFNSFIRYSHSPSIKTTRLHAYLPALAIGVPQVHFTNPFETDSNEWFERSRFEGLLQLARNDKERELNALILTNRIIETLDRLLVCGVSDVDVYDTFHQLTTISCDPQYSTTYTLKQREHWRAVRTALPAVLHCSLEHTDIPIESCLMKYYRSRTTTECVLRTVPLHKFRREGTVVVTFDQGFKDIAHVMLRSLSITNPTILWKVYCLVRDVDDLTSFQRECAKLHNIVLLVRKCTYTFLRYFTHLDHVSVSCMDRLQLAILPYQQPVNRVLYLDLDIIITGSIEPLLDADVGPIGIMAKSSVIQNNVKRWIQKYNLPLQYNWSRSFNAGVLVCDVLTLVKNNFHEKVFKLADMFGVNDQVILNLYCDNKYKELDSKYNLFFGKDKDGDKPIQWHMNPDQLPKIVHFVGSKKPWNTVLDGTDLWNYYAHEQYKQFIRKG